MRDVRIKICGLRRPQDVEYVNELLPDFAGFVFAKSKRQVTPAQAQQLKQLLNPAIKAVGVFVNADIDFPAKLAQAGILDVIQLHGDEDAAYIAALRQKTSLPIIKAVRVRDAQSLKGLEQIDCDYLLFDTYAPGQYGGTGQRFDVVLTAANIPKPYFVAGGLDSGNVADVLQRTHAFGVDVSGGVETDGFKDKEKIAAFIANVRRDNND